MIFFACEEGVVSFILKYSLALSNLRFREGVKENVAEDDGNVTHRSLLSDILNSIWKKLKWNWLDCVYCFQRDEGGVECLSISLATVEDERERSEQREEEDRLVIRFLLLSLFMTWKERMKRRRAELYDKKWWATFNSFKNSMNDDGVFQPLAKSSFNVSSSSFLWRL